uniref:C2H2-type domain-containing protein n=1 Tax=Anopheles quadriannulatus TaxID=34691 RepID=A0A182WUA3_ANOQN
MSSETMDSSESASCEAVFGKEAICKDVNNNGICLEDAAALPDSIPPSYMKTITSLTMSRTLRGPKYHCYDCDYVLPTRLSMNTHMKMHRKPFCPICYTTFAEEQEVTAHTAENHSILFSTAITPLVVLDEPIVVKDEPIVVKEEHAFFQTEVPPNSPTHEYHGLSEMEYGFAHSNNSSIPLLLAEKLREHQEMVNRGMQSRKRLDSSRHQRHSLDETEARSVIKSHRNSYTGRRDRRPSIAGVTGKVHKPASKPNRATPSTPKAGTSARGESVDSADTALKRITSRFGRSISLKIPQF